MYRINSISLIFIFFIICFKYISFNICAICQEDFSIDLLLIFEKVYLRILPFLASDVGVEVDRPMESLSDLLSLSLLSSTLTKHYSHYIHLVTNTKKREEKERKYIN